MHSFIHLKSWRGQRESLKPLPYTALISAPHTIYQAPPRVTPNRSRVSPYPPKNVMATAMSRLTLEVGTKIIKVI